jgi:hypothetical protein
MNTIKFADIPQHDTDDLVEVFNYIAESKRGGHIDEDKLAGLLKERYKTKFWWPTEEEKTKWFKKWKSTPAALRDDDPYFKTPWDFGSWVDALQNSEINYIKIEINHAGEGNIQFEQLSFPSGGLETTEEIIKIFDGTIVSNDGI